MRSTLGVWFGLVEFFFFFGGGGLFCFGLLWIILDILGFGLVWFLFGVFFFFVFSFVFCIGLVCFVVSLSVLYGLFAL